MVIFKCGCVFIPKFLVIQTVLFHLHFPPLYTQVPGGLLLGMGVLQLLFYVFVRKGKVRGGVFGVS